MTPKQILKRALRYIGVLRASEEPSASEANDALEVFNDMLKGFQIDGVKINHVDAAWTDTLPYPDELKDPFVYLSAARLAPEYGKQVDQLLYDMADKGKRTLQNYFLDLKPMAVDNAIHPYYSPNRHLTN